MRPGAIPHDVGVDLLHALVAAAAGAASARILVIKGPTLARQDLRPERSSADVDALVHPADLERVLEVLSAWGWHPRVADQSLQPPHSVTLIHAAWGADLDVHRSFPGIGAAEAVAFDALWHDHRRERFAGRSVDVPSPVANAVILALHATRDRAEPGGADGIALAASAVARLPRREVMAAVAELDAAVAFEAVAVAAGLAPTPPDGLDAGRMRTWRVTTSTRDRTGPLLARILAAPWRRRPAMIARALWPSETVIRAENPDLAPGRRAVTRRRLHRLATGLRSLPTAISALRRSRTSP